MIELRADVTDLEIDVIVANYVAGSGEFPIDNGRCYFHEKE